MIDSHFHIWTEDNSTPEKRAERADQVRKEAEAMGVDRIALIGEVGNTVEECRKQNRVVAKYAEEHPDVFYGWARVDPRLGEDAVAEFRRAVEEDGLVGLKHHFHGTPVNISDEPFFPLAEAAVDMDVPIIAHVMQRLETDKEDWDDAEAYTEDVMELARRYPDLKLISAHIVAGGDAEYRIKNVEHQDNVILDVSGSNCETDNLEMAVDRLGTDRLVFGTDTWFMPGVGKLEGADLTPEQKADIAYGFEELLADNVPNSFDEAELEERKAQARERFRRVGADRDEFIVDANAWVGNWPFKDLDASAADVVALMDEKGVDRAVVSSIDSVMLRNCHRGNRKLADEIEDHRERFIPLATINPSYTAWEQDLDESLDDLGMEGVRLLPNYHHYDLNASDVKELFDACAARDVPVFVASTLEDQRQRHPTMTLRGFEDGGTRNLPEEYVDQLIETLTDCPETDVVIADAWTSAYDITEAVCEKNPSGVRLNNFVRDGETLFDLADLYCYFSYQAAEIVEKLGTDRLVVGPQLPYKIFEAYYNRVDALPVSEAERDAVRADNVLSLFE